MTIARVSPPGSPRATARDEEPVYFPAGAHQLFGVLTRPVVESNSCAVLLIKGGSPNLVSFQRNRLAVRIARRAAGLGYHVLRFDWHGVGESGGPLEAFRLDRPFGDDVVAAVKWLQAQGFAQVLLVGSCYGGRAALMAARKLHGIGGVVLVSLSVAYDLYRLRADNLAVSQYERRGMDLHRLRRLFNSAIRRAYARKVWDKVRAIVARRWSRLTSRDAIDPTLVSTDVFGQLKHLLDHRVPVRFIYGTEDPFYRHFRRVNQGAFGRFLARYGDLVEVSADIEGVVHDYTTVAVQDGTVEAVAQWLRHRLPTTESQTLVAEQVGS